MRNILRFILFCVVRCTLGILSLLGMCVILTYLGV